jgi:hypothetical protein
VSPRRVASDRDKWRRRGDTLHRRHGLTGHRCRHYAGADPWPYGDRTQPGAAMLRYYVSEPDLADPCRLCCPEAYR